MKKNIIAIVGMAGSGKTETIKYLQKKYGWPNVYFGEVMFERMKKDGLQINWDNEKLTREQMRKEKGMGVMALLSVPKVEKALQKNNTVLIESLYSWAEYKIIKEKFGEKFKIIAISTPRDLRFRRLRKRRIRPMKTKKEFNDRDYSEIENSDKGGPIAISDYTAINDTTLKKLHTTIDKIINTMLQ